MRVIHMIATAGADGRLRLDIPTAAAGDTFEVAVVLHAVPPDELMPTRGVIDDDTFDARRPTDPPPAGSLANLFGSITDETFVAPPRGMPRPVPPLDAD